MPVYAYKCPCGMRFDRWLPLARYDEAQTCDECGEVATKQILPTTIRVDIPAYVSPVTGNLVDGRAARREDLKRSGCRPWEGMEQEQKEAARIREYEEQAADLRLERGLAEVAAAKELGVP